MNPGRGFRILAVFAPLACAFAVITGEMAWAQERWTLVALDAFLAGVDATLTGVAAIGILMTARR